MTPRLIVCSVLMLFITSTALAEVVVTGVVPGDGLAPRAALHQQGVTLPVDGETPLLACSTMAGGVDMQGVLWTGDRNFLIFGDDGPWLTDTDGCHWIATFGPVSERRVVAAYQAEPGSKRVLFAASGDLGVTGVMVSEDGGYTSEVLAGLSFGELELQGLAGHGDRVGILGQNTDGDLRGWISEDGGVTFTERVMPESDPEKVVRLGALDADGAWWIWIGDTLHHLELDGGSFVEERRFAEGPRPLSCSPQGEVWAAGGSEGLWRRDPNGSWERVLPDTTTAVHASTGTCWSGHRADLPGAPMVRWSNDGGVSWSVPLVAPDTWDFATGCETSSNQVCAGDVDSAWPGALDELGGDPPTAASEGGCGAASVDSSSGWLSCFLILLPLMILAFRRRLV